MTIRAEEILMWFCLILHGALVGFQADWYPFVSICTAVVFVLGLRLRNTGKSYCGGLQSRPYRHTVMVLF